MKTRYIIPDRNHLAESCAIAAEYNTAFEYNDFFNSAILDVPGKAEEIIRQYKALGRDCSEDTLHGAFYDITISSSDTKIRETSEYRMRQSMHFAAALGAKAVIFHTNYIEGMLPSSYRKVWLRKNELFFRKLLEEFPTLEIYMENMFDTNPILLSQLAHCLQDEPRFGVCFDIAHASISNTPLPIWFDHLAPYIRHMHINDTNGIEDEHLPVGSGSICWRDYQHYLIQYKIRPTVLVEVRNLDAVRESIRYLTSEQIYPYMQSEDAELIHLTEDMKNIVNIGISLTSEKSYSKLLDMIIDRAMEVTCSDAGTLYLLEPDGLRFIIMRNKSMNVYQGSAGEPVNLPKVPLSDKNVCSYCALHRQIINIQDVYHCEGFDFSGPRDYDRITGYHTQSMLVIPLENHEGVVLGVLQLMNAKQDDETIIPYTWDDEYIVYSMASQTSVTMSNMQYIKEIKGFLYSVVSVMTTAIEEQTPYNANHTYHVARFTTELVDFINKKHAAGETELSISDNHKEQLILAAYLHDIGKLVVPLEVMNKMSRLGSERREVIHRFELIRAYLKIDFLEQRLDKEAWEQRTSELDEAASLIDLIDTIPVVSDEMIAHLNQIAQTSYIKSDGSVFFYLTPKELECLSVRQGTLTVQERAIMENHVITTSRLLEKMHFGKDYEFVAEWASNHHESLDGSGYPNHLKADQLSLEVRILIVVDIFEALTSVDRPYKRSCSTEKALQILQELADTNKVDGRIVAFLAEYLKTNEA